MPHPSSKLLSEIPTKEFIEEYSHLTQFHGIPDHTLMRLAESKTGLQVANRWVAIALIIRNPVPIPVPRPTGFVAATPKTPTPPAKLVIVAGGKNTPPRIQQKPSRANWLTW